MNSNFWLIGLFLFTALSLFALPTEKRIKMELKQAKVYSNGIQILAECKAEADIGQNKWRLVGLPSDLDESYIQVQVKSVDAYLISSAYIPQKQYTLYAREIKLLEDSIARAEFQIDSLSELLHTYKKEETMILQNQILAGEEGSFKIHELEDLADFYEERFTQIHLNKYKTQLRYKALSVKYQSLLRKSTRLIAQSTAMGGELSILIQANVKTTLTVEVSYASKRGGWSPIYELHAKPKEEQVSLVQKAKIWQHTLQIWDKTPVKLVHANLWATLSKPEVDRIVVDIEPQATTLKRDKVAFATVPGAQDMHEEKDLSESPMYYDMVTKSDSYTQAVYDISGLIQISGDSTPVAVEIERQMVKPIFRYILTPSKSKNAIYVAGLTGNMVYTLKNAPLSVFVDGVYTGQTVVQLKNISDTIDVPIYEDNKILCKREELVDFKSQKMIGSTIKQDIGYVFQIKNTSEKAVRIQLVEAIPVSANAQVEVEALPESAMSLDTQLGLAKWEFLLGSGDTKNLQLRYSIKYPKGKKLIFR